DQPHCAFVPHCLVHFPSYKDKTGKVVSTGQKMVIKNSAKISHNTKYNGGVENPGGNPTLPSGDTRPITLEPSLEPVTVQCGIHPWMSGYVFVRDNPYYAVTDKDGNFEIKNVPAGDVNIVVWHEKGGYATSGGAKGEKLTLGDKETEKNFTLKGK